MLLQLTIMVCTQLQSSTKTKLIFTSCYAVGVCVRLHVHLKLDTAPTLSGKTPNGDDIKKKCIRKLVFF